MRKRYLLLFMPMVVAACTWVKPTTGSQKVVLANTGEVAGCSKKGVTTSKTVGKILFIPRSKEKVFTELVLLAKNEAAVMGGDTVVAQAAKEPGTREFGVYKCR